MKPQTKEHITEKIYSEEDVRRIMCLAYERFGIGFSGREDFISRIIEEDLFRTEGGKQLVMPMNDGELADTDQQLTLSGIPGTPLQAQLTDLRNMFYASMPKGKVNGWDFIEWAKNLFENFDLFIDGLSGAVPEPGWIKQLEEHVTKQVEYLANINRTEFGEGSFSAYKRVLEYFLAEEGKGEEKEGFANG